MSASPSPPPSTSARATHAHSTNRNDDDHHDRDAVIARTLANLLEHRPDLIDEIVRRYGSSDREPPRSSPLSTTHDTPPSQPSQPSVVAVYATWLWMLRGVVGAHHALRGDERLALMYTTSGALAGTGFVLDAIFIPLQCNVHRPSFVVRALRLWYSFTYAQLAAFAARLAITTARDDDVFGPALPPVAFVPAFSRAAARCVMAAALVVAGEMNAPFGVIVAAVGWHAAMATPTVATNDDYAFLFGIFVLTSIWRFLFGSGFGVGYNFPVLPLEPDSRKLGRAARALLRASQNVATLAWLAVFLLYAATAGLDDALRHARDSVSSSFSSFSARGDV